MDSIQTLFILMFAAAILVGIAQKLRIPYPIALVLGGTVMGFIPGLPSINFDPNLILLIVLPPILYYAAFGISFREFKKNWRYIFSLALGLVIVTTLVVGFIFKWMFPEFPWALAFAFGAIISPPDAIAATTILKRFSISPRLLTLLEGESLINDASALILYKLAVTALLTGVFSFSDASIEFVKVASGGVVIGLALGFLLQNFSRVYLDPVVGVVFSFSIPYVTFILASSLGVSGVLAVVVNGLMGSRVLAAHHSSLRRVLGFTTWDIFNILLNCFVFVLIGIQLSALTDVMTVRQMLLYTGYAFIITFAMIAVRMLWVYAKNGVAYLYALHKPRANTICPQIMHDAVVIGWAGMRGIVSLAAALALPFTLPNGTPLEGRNEVIFISFVVILLTLLIPGLSLTTIINMLKIPHYDEHHEEHRVRKELAKIAEDKIESLHGANSITRVEYEFLITYFHLQRRVLEIASSPRKKMKNLETIRLDVIHEQRKKLLEMWERLEIDDKLLNRLEHELDVEETHVTRAELK